MRRRRFIRRKRVTRRRVPRRQRTNGSRFFKFSYQLPLTNVATSTRINDNPLDMPASTPALTQFQALQNLFGFYRVNAIKITSNPTHTVAPTNVTQVNSRTYVWHDWDILGTTDRAGLVNREAVRSFNSMQPWKFYRKCHRTFPVLSASGTVGANAWIATQTPMVTQNILVNAGESSVTPVSTLRVTMYCAFRQRI